MIRKEDILADMHTHTIFSRHAYSTVEENITYAAKAGMRFIAITDHYFHDGDECNKDNERCRIRFLENNVNPHSDIKVISSAEFNIMQDMEYRNSRSLSHLKWRPIGLHNDFAPKLHDMTFDDLYKEFETASEWNNEFNHIERELESLRPGKFNGTLPEEAKHFLEKIVILAKEKNIFLEINEHSLEPGRNYDEIIRYWLNIAAENGNRFCLGTDAHFCREVGQFEKGIAILNEFGITKDRVLNCNEDELKGLLRF